MTRNDSPAMGGRKEEEDHFSTAISQYSQALLNSGQHRAKDCLCSEWREIRIIYDHTSGQVISWFVTKENVHDARIFPRRL